MSWAVRSWWAKSAGLIGYESVVIYSLIRRWYCCSPLRISALQCDFLFSRLRKIKTIMTASLDKDLIEIISRLPEIFLRHLNKAAVPLVMTIKSQAISAVGVSATWCIQSAFKIRESRALQTNLSMPL